MLSIGQYHQRDLRMKPIVSRFHRRSTLELDQDVWLWVYKKIVWKVELVVMRIRLENERSSKNP